MQENDLQAGVAGEHLVCADLFLKGHHAFLTGQGLHYDIAADIHGQIFKIQVKATRKPKNVPQKTLQIPAYIFHVGRNGKDARRKDYGAEQVDFFALVALDTKQIAYIPNSGITRTVVLRVPELRGTYHNEQGEKKRQLILKMKGEGFSFEKIKKELNTSCTMISYYLAGGEVANGGKRRGVYLDDFTLQNCLTKIFKDSVTNK